ncbi:hypothetical protein XBKQ1_2440005 [Xenorhabdus bovienii str. kraussei Quebec]|uniref:Uncharacterized protein n=2 Tax=Xenorhabdus bovienii TaxID=40576 RepID=A0A077PHE8_XENBV|nr:hypothetical protein [Xenorhabdus bovienii]CDH20097.1 hypothetical protein XBKQ1_2440005 [Xenorhabdus bovienii str. kraussei Quebec]
MNHIKHKLPSQDGALNEKSVWVKIYPIDSGLTWNPKASSFQWEGKEEIKNKK